MKKNKKCLIVTKLKKHDFKDFKESLQVMFLFTLNNIIDP